MQLLRKWIGIAATDYGIPLVSLAGMWFRPKRIRSRAMVRPVLTKFWGQSTGEWFFA
jgi:hypothetical protein